VKRLSPLVRKRYIALCNGETPRSGGVRIT
jgi:hypothetical protein